MSALAEEEGLGGWLVLVAIGVCLTPFRQLFVFLQDVLALTGGRFDIYAQASGPYYRPWLKLMLYVESLGDLVLLVVAVWLAVLFFRKQRRFKTAIQVFMFAQLLWIAVAYLRAAMTPEQTIIDQYDEVNAIVDFLVQLLICVIFIPYFWFSQRVKRTFVNENENL